MPPAERPRPASGSAPPARPRPRGAAGGIRGGRGGGPVVEETSAGGLVVLHRGGVPHVALIGRINRSSGRLEWCLPKGHLEGEETAEQAAVREIAEETGIVGVVDRALGAIDYWFAVEGRRVHKTVHHYLLTATGGVLSVDGDPDAEAVEAAWVPLAELPQRLAFANERRIARGVAALLSGAS